MDAQGRRPRLLATALCLLALAACGPDTPDGGDVTGAGETGAGPGGQPGGVTTDTGTEGRHTTFADLERAVIQIEATGTFEVPGEGAFESAGRGSGFLIDPSGLALTNNHVVTGAGTLDVWLDGERHNAQVLGVSECLDLAVVDVEGDNLPFLEWHDGDITNALEVWAAGFPLGDPEFTITRGIVSKQDTSGATSWAALDHIIEHDARIRGGNSGGPLVDEQGRVVGVNYAGDDALDFSFAIHRDEVLRVVEDLKAGTDVLSLGVNGQAWVSEDGSASGIFVASVGPGSPADQAGVEPGDLITSLQGVSLAADGTMDEYCSVLRTHGQDATLDIAVYRPAEDTAYEGQVNGEPLVAQSIPVVPDAAEDPPADREFVSVSDDSGVVSVTVPADWSDVNGASFTDDLGNLFYDVTVSTDIDDFLGTWDVSGVQVGASSDALDDYTPEGYLDEQGQSVLSESCTAEGDREPYDDGVYEGVYDVWVGCGQTDATFVRIAAVASDSSYFVRVNMQLLDEDLDVLEAVLSSFMAQTS
jgi:serine protease Do